jgi:hypothetical protein
MNRLAIILAFLYFSAAVAAQQAGAPFWDEIQAFKSCRLKVRSFLRAVLHLEDGQMYNLIFLLTRS